jgi:UDP-glucose:glycoprotein glucosyltransferase
MWLVGDLNSPDGYKLVKDALKHLQSEGCKSRLGFIHYSTYDHRIATGHDSSSILHQLVSLLRLRAVSPQEVLELLEHNNEDGASFAKRRVSRF